jgi:hypothetical protein
VSLVISVEFLLDSTITTSEFRERYTTTLFFDEEADTYGTVSFVKEKESVVERNASNGIRPRSTLLHETKPLVDEKNASMSLKNKTAGFIHIGKTGGSSLTSVLRNGCHSFVPKPCSVISNETIISELVTDYYHST